MTVKPHQTTQELLQAAHHADCPHLTRRLQAVAMAQQSLSGATIADLLGDHERSVRRWVAIYNEGGIDALADAPRSGRPRKLKPEEEAAFLKRLDDGPMEQDSVHNWHGKDYQRILREEFGQTYSLNGVYALLHRLEYSWLVPRPQHEKADPQAQEDFKKNRRAHSGRSGRSPRSARRGLVPG